MAGLIVGSRSISYVDPSDVGSIFVIYIAVFVIRCVLLAICHYPIHYMIPEYSSKEAAFVAFAGLRGAVSLALALLLTQHAASDPSLTHGDSDLILYPREHI